MNHYGTIEIAGDIDAALDKANKEYGLRVGLAELGANRLAEHANQGLTDALDARRIQPPGFLLRPPGP